MDGMNVSDIIKAALAEDIGHGDVTTGACVDPDAEGTAVVIAKEGFILAGYEVFLEVFLTLDPSVDFSVNRVDGERVKKGEVIMELAGPLATLLTGERVALNLMQRMSGIATLTDKYVRAVSGTNARILDTRKTTPGLRVLEKYAVTVGGGYNHRFGLSDGILIKDNHIAAAGGIAAAVIAAREYTPHTLRIEVECETLDDVKAALGAGVEIIMLDNMDVATMKKAVKLIGDSALVEASGNMTLKHAAEAAKTGVDLISVGALTHSAPAVDISMKIM